MLKIYCRRLLYLEIDPGNYGSLPIRFS
ncbi:hypothetical protein TELCIR_01061 [Teladorsagia circumcincta]|uniref:Uncharacterized protein n=1 Tax=Teladorsagia circumcincta TaxID=45464 RepID=A0A2G9V2Z6_TELCI|nr:hypothetical protein TELCIR_01061 [Teladorsagia circumcincta]